MRFDLLFPLLLFGQSLKSRRVAPICDSVQGCNGRRAVTLRIRVVPVATHLPCLDVGQGRTDGVLVRTAALISPRWWMPLSVTAGPPGCGRKPCSTGRPSSACLSASNFLGQGSNQPVSASGNALAGFGVVDVDGPELATVRPYIGAGLGAARTSLGQVTYRIPAISSDAVTVTSGGSSTSFAYLLTAGVSIPVSERLDLDLAYRWTDLGTVKTNAGSAKIVRPAGRSNLKIAGTQIDLQSQAVLASLRFRF